MRLLVLALLIGLIAPLQAWAQASKTQCVSTAVAGGTGNAITIPLLPCTETTTELILTISAANTIANPTISVGGQTPHVVLNFDGTPLGVGTLQANQRRILTYSGVNWLVLNSGTVGPAGPGAAATFDPRTYGAVCNPTVDSTTAIQAAVDAATVGGGEVVIICPMRVDGTVTLKDSVRLTGIGPIFYRGMLDTAPDGSAVAATWPPAKGPAINCTNASNGGCLLITGIGVEIDHLNFGNPMPTPPTSGIGTYNPPIFPFVITTSAAANWNGLHLHHLTFTSTSNCIDLEGTPDYLTSGIAGAQWTIDHIWGNPCMKTFLREARVDNTGRVDNVDLDWWWYRNNEPVGFYMENNSIGLDLCYAANTQFHNIEFLYNKSAIQFTNCTVVGGFGHTGAADNLQFDNISFNLPCQAVSIPNGNGTRVSGIFTNVLAFQDNSWCNGATVKNVNAFVPVFFDFAADDINITMAAVRGGGVQTFAAIGHGTGGNLWISGLNVQAYSNFATGAPAFRVSHGAHFMLQASDYTTIVPQTGAGPLEGPGFDGTQQYMQPVSVGSGTTCGEGGASLAGSATSDSGFVGFYPCPAVGPGPNGRNGFVGLSNGGGVNLAADMGSVFLLPNIATGSSPFMRVGSSGGTLLINVNHLPTSCTGLPTGTLWDNANIIQACP